MKNVEPFYSDADEQIDEQEGTVAKAIEHQTAKLPSDLFLWIAGGAIAASIAFRFAGKRDAANWVGEWVPTLLILGTYNKMVKLMGHDRNSMVEE
jgi:hypothetical protein